MSAFSEKLKQALRAHNQSCPLYSFPSPELGDLLGMDSPLNIYHKTRTLKAASKAEKRSKGNTDDLVVYNVIFNALDEKGEPLFDVGDKDFLLNELHSQVLIDISNQLCAFKGVAAQKKS